MVDFRKHAKPRNYLARREQVRLLMLVMGLGLVALLMTEVRKPAALAWLARIFDAPDVQQKEPEQVVEPIDTRVRQRREPSEIPGTFISPAPLDETVDKTGKYFPGVRPGYFHAIKDDLPLRSGEEHYPWFHMLEVLDGTDEETLEKASTGRATWAQLFRQSNEYRGELVTIVGTVRRAHHIYAPKNNAGIEGTNQLWVFPEDNPAEPIIVYSLYLPEGFPMGMEIAEEASVTGFFFKRWVYASLDDVRTAPLMLSRNINWKKKPPKPEEPPFDPIKLIAELIGVIISALVICTLVIIRVYWQTRTPRRE
jgi:hypothetical protein